MSSSLSHQLRWHELTNDARDALTGKLVGLWGAASDETAFDSLTEDKQQALLLVFSRMQAKRSLASGKKH